MPISYQIPPWLHPADPLRAAEGGALLGQRIAESNQRAAQEYMMLQQRQSEFAQHMAMQERQLEQAQVMQQQQFQAEQEIHHQNQLQKEQQLAVENAYKQAQIGLGKQKLELTAQAAAKKFQTQQMIQSEINSDTQSMVAEEGMDPDEARQKATVRAYMRHATDLGLNPAAIGQLAKSSTDQNNEGEWRTGPGGQDYYYEKKSGVIRFPPKPVPTPQMQEADLKVKEISKEISDMVKEQKDAQTSGKSPDELHAIQQKIFDAQGVRRDLLKQKAGQPIVPTTQPVAPTGAPTAAPAASPQAFSAMAEPIPVTGLKKEDLIDKTPDGLLQPYITAKGIAIWDKNKERFVPAESFASEAPTESPDRPADES